MIADKEEKQKIIRIIDFIAAFNQSSDWTQTYVLL